MPFKSDRDIYLNADKSAVVEEGDPDAAFLLVGAGSEIDDTEAAKYGLKSTGKTEDKAVAAPEDDKTEQDDTEGDELACPECDFVAKSAGGLTRHAKTHE